MEITEVPAILTIFLLPSVSLVPCICFLRFLELFGFHTSVHKTDGDVIFSDVIQVTYE
jgi:hypothetical protein